MLLRLPHTAKELTPHPAPLALDPAAHSQPPAVQLGFDADADKSSSSCCSTPPESPHAAPAALDGVACAAASTAAPEVQRLVLQIPDVTSPVPPTQQQLQCLDPAAPAALAAECQPASPAASGGEGVPAVLSELGVSLDSLTRLLTGDCSVECQQPVWMVVNLQGKIKGSYTAAKMLEFSQRGTLSAAQRILGIDKDLPYVARQELDFYRPLSAMLQAVHAGARYSPLTTASLKALAQEGKAPACWQPLQLPLAATNNSPTSDGCVINTSSSSISSSSSDDSDSSSAGPCTAPDSLSSPSSPMVANSPSAATDDSGSSSGALEAAEAAAARLLLALERLTGSSGSSSGTTTEGPSDSTDGVSRALPGCDPATPDAAAAGAAAASLAGSPTTAEGTSSSETLWLYINHLGWCRGPFPGDKLAQAHLCGRLPRDTLVVGAAPDVPPSLLCADVAHFFRPFGVLLDNVANGWRYQPVNWQAVNHKKILTKSQVMPAATSAATRSEPQAAWTPLV